MSLRRSLAALALALCTLSTTGCGNTSITFEGPSIKTPWFSFPSKELNPLQISGEEKWHSGDYQGALEDFNELIKEEPNNAYAYFSRASALLGLNKPHEALDDANKAIELDPNIPEAYETRGVAKAMLDNPGGAILDMNKAIDLNENFTSAYSNRGEMKSALGNYDDALIDLNKAIEIDPNYERAYLHRAKNYNRQGNITDACKDFKKAASLGDSVAIDILNQNPDACKRP